ncbi:MAG: mandelate racemase/muconate lactonizing enzyme family protein [Rhodospirillaceae bacterium]|nr:mandelate racemase/muconate lactonizing enzyme family protein [Rhodospirillaceae bacterium]MDD9916814.1 mandelate racemase/muconate lactonizing enzyme family protein [Rhodospirillaceae bacterium]MDD9924534.1 mandelate racemase/muconate lactonizing enzyme family protein [Rhodospirillaceae bacterium]
MKVTGVEILVAGAGWRNFNFVKVSTDEGLTGWADFSQGNVGGAIAPLVEHMGRHLVGKDPRQVQPAIEELRRRSWGVSIGAAARAIGPLENALVDIKAKALGISVHEMLGGALRDPIRLYWSHCGSYHVTNHETLCVDPIRSLDDITRLGARVRDAGYHALKCNLIMFDRDTPYLYGPGWVGGNGDADRNPVRAATRAAVDQMQAFRDGAGAGVGLHLDTNFNFRTEGFLRMARALEPLDLEWLEVDNFDATAVADLRRGTTTPIASCETLTGLRQLRPFLDHRAADVVIIDVMYNGILEALRMAALCDAFEVNVATHNYSGPIGSLITAAYCGVLPNFRVMEIDVDQVPWAYDLLTVKPVIENGHMGLLPGPGWGAEVDEEAVKAHPPIQEKSGLV